MVKDTNRLKKLYLNVSRQIFSEVEVVRRPWLLSLIITEGFTAIRNLLESNIAVSDTRATWGPTQGPMRPAKRQEKWRFKRTIEPIGLFF